MANKPRPRTIAREIVRKMEINDGDVVLLKRGEFTESLRMFNALRNALGATGRERCIIMVVNEWDDVKTLNSREMLTYGWQWVGLADERPEG